jgi:heptosyltransferase-2
LVDIKEVIKINLGMPLKSGELAFLRLLRLLFSPRGRITDRQIPADPRSILLVKPSERLGNLVLMNSAIDALASAFPDSRIDLLLPKAFADILAGDSRINQIIRVRKREYILNPFELIRLIGNLRRRRYDLAIDCSDVNSHSLTAAAYTLLSAPGVSAGWRLGDHGIFDFEVPRYTEALHAIDMIPRLFSAIFGRELSGDPYFESRSSQLGLKESTVGINCGGRGSKRWPLENFMELGRRLSSEGFDCEFILGPDERNQRSEVEGRLANKCRLLTEMAIVQLKETIARYSLFVSSDSGPMHLAWTQRVPTIAIFLESEMEKFKPLSPGSVALDGKSGVTVDRVYDLAIRALKRNSASRAPGVRK